MAIDNATHDQLEHSINEINWKTIRRPTYRSSPAAWEDLILYFLMLDRFSNGQEHGYLDITGKPVTDGTIPPFTFDDDAYTADRDSWAKVGNIWQECPPPPSVLT